MSALFFFALYIILSYTKHSLNILLKIDFALEKTNDGWIFYKNNICSFFRPGNTLVQKKWAHVSSVWKVWGSKEVITETPVLFGFSHFAFEIRPISKNHQLQQLELGSVWTEMKHSVKKTTWRRKAGWYIKAFIVLWKHITHTGNWKIFLIFSWFIPFMV